MWPLNLPAREILRLPGATSIPWAVFDASWYRNRYPDATAHLAEAGPEAVLAFWFDTGQGLGHSPNMLFDEAWHRRAYPGIAGLVDAGTFPSAFDAWCRGGCLERSPHWLFDETDYRRREPELTDAFLRRNGLVNGYDHYLWRGNAEGRIAHPFFDPAVYRSGLSPEEADAMTADGPFWHCLRRMHRREPEVPTSLRFDPVWYLDRYPAVRRAIAEGTWRWAIEHYLCNDTPTEFDPLPAFSEAYYLARHDDAAGMVRRGEIRNGYAHFLRHGVSEARSPVETIDLEWYAAREDVRRDLDQGAAEDAFIHWLTIGQPGGWPSRPAVETPVTESAARTLFRQQARTLSVLHARAGLNFATAEALAANIPSDIAPMASATMASVPVSSAPVDTAPVGGVPGVGAPAVSAIIVPRDGFELTMRALGSLRANFAGDIELVLIDRGSADETRDIERYVHGATYFRFDGDIGELPARNTALQFATADLVLFLSDTVDLAPGAIAAALRRLHDDPRIGAVGGMVLNPDETVWEAGGLIGPDGAIASDGRGASPLAPELNYTRDAAFCSGVFLLARRSVLNALEGFETAFAAGGYADADLCLRIARAGHRVVYDPAVRLQYLDNVSQASAAETGQARELFAARHAAYLAERPPLTGTAPLFARVADPARRRVLFIEDTVPLRRIGSGFVRSNDIVRTMASMGYAVTVYPINGCRFDVAAVYADIPAEVEVMHDHTLERFDEFLAARSGYYDVIWLARTHNLAGVRAALDRVYGVEGPERPVGPGGPVAGAPPPVVLDTEAIGSVREAQQAALDGVPFDLAAAIRHELRDAPFCRSVVAINEAEAALARDAGIQDVAVLGHLRAVRPTPRPFEERGGMLFVGAIHRMDSPNYDSLCWFIDEVLPLIGRELTWRTRLTVVGYTGKDVVLDRFRDHPRVTLRGPVTDLTPLYDSHRVFVAPTRIAAGVPYKVHEAASFGLPVVATDVLRRQLGWTAGMELLAAEADDPAGFAGRVIALQRDETLWRCLRAGALARLRLENNANTYQTAILRVLGPPRAPGE
jgi:GT2 family glycosyltransferase